MKIYFEFWKKNKISHLHNNVKYNQLNELRKKLKKTYIDLDQSDRMCFLYNFLYKNKIDEFKNELKNVDINNLKKYCEFLFVLACIHGRFTIVQILSNDYYHWTDFSYVCCNGYFEIVDLLVQDPWININILNKYDFTAFHFAYISENINIINLFFASNRKINFEKQTTKQCYGYFLGTTSLIFWKRKI